MAKAKSIYICQSCGYETPNWVGKCPNCDAWNTLVETLVEEKRPGKYSKAKVKSIEPVKMTEVKKSVTRRVMSKIKEFDRVLGGGFVPGQAVLIAGTPGIGKSTLLTQLAQKMSTTKVLYVCGEESISQIKIRTERMNYPADNLYLLPETNVDLIVESISSYHEKEELGLIIVDSIQTLYSNDLTGMAGSVGQVRGSTAKIVDLVKRLGIPTVMVGHVTKEGTVAGPKVLEHMVDTVLYLEGDSSHLFRVLKTTKNRFGPVSEVGIFEMQDKGMIEVRNPSKLFLGSGGKKPSGTCVTAIMEGYRPIMFEIQALTVKTSFGYPKRTSSGYNINRLHVLIATLEKRAGLDLSNYDVYLSVSGGYKVSDYSCDLAVCLAITSSLKDKPLRDKTVAFGECDLSGGVRKVPYQGARKKEAKKLGYENLVSPDEVSSIRQAIKKAF